LSRLCEMINNFHFSHFHSQKTESLFPSSPIISDANGGMSPIPNQLHVLLQQLHFTSLVPNLGLHVPNSHLARSRLAKHFSLHTQLLLQTLLSLSPTSPLYHQTLTLLLKLGETREMVRAHVGVSSRMREEAVTNPTNYSSQSSSSLPLRHPQHILNQEEDQDNEGVNETSKPLTRLGARVHIFYSYLFFESLL